MPNGPSCDKEWEQAESTKFPKVRNIKKHIKDYSYSDEHNAVLTEERICEFLVKEIRAIKEILFYIIQDAYELQKEPLDTKIEKIRDDLDIFSDEIKARHFEWDINIPQNMLGRIIDMDYEIIKILDTLKKDIEKLRKAVLSVAKPGSKIFNRGKWDSVIRTIKGIKDSSDRLAKAFRERDTIANIRKITFQKTLEEEEVNHA